MNPIARTHAILTEAVGNELIVYDQEAQKAHRLSPTAAFLWRHCDGTRSMSDLARLAHRQIGVPEDEELVLLALESLTSQRLVKASSTRDGSGVSRRDALKRLRAVGLTAAMIPIITTIAAPPPAAAASPKTRTRTSGPADFFEDTWKTGRRGDKPGLGDSDGGLDGGKDPSDSPSRRKPADDFYQPRPWR